MRAAFVRSIACSLSLLCSIAYSPNAPQETCPLCIEELDETDKDFYPCPCGCVGLQRRKIFVAWVNVTLSRRYQVCLFCYGRIGDLCKNQCPGCRREYGAPVEAPIIRISDERAASDAPPEYQNGATHRLSGNGGNPNGNLPSLAAATGLGREGSIATPRREAAATAAVSAALGMRATGLAQHSRRPPEQQQRQREEPAAAAAAAALPTGATWAAAPAVSRHPSSDHVTEAAAPAASDESAWPSLGAATAAAPTAAPMRQQQQQQLRSEHSNRTLHQEYSETAASAAAVAVPSPYSLSSQGPQQDRRQKVPQHLLDAFATAQVSSVVHGQRHTVNVPLAAGAGANGGAGGVDPLPEAAELRAAMQRNVASGAMSSQEAAARLVALLRRPPGATPAVTASAAAASAKPGQARAPPPGFGGLVVAPPPGFGSPLSSAASSLTVSASSSQQPQQPKQQQGGGFGSIAVTAPLISQNDPSVAPPSLGRYQPIQPPGILHPTIKPPPGAGLGPAVGGGLFSAAPGSNRTLGGAGAGTSDTPPGLFGGGGLFAGVGLQSSNAAASTVGLRAGAFGGGLLGGGGGYSMWGGPLPGIDLGAPLWDGAQQKQQQGPDLQRSNGGGAHAQQPLVSSSDSAYSSMDAAVAYTPQAASAAPGAPIAPKAPPPGFGGPPMAAAGPVAARPYQPFGSVIGAPLGAVGVPSYNPLQAAAAAAAVAAAQPPGLARGPPPGMATFRPQVGL